MADRTCVRCGKVFKAPCRLRDHHQRKTPCDPIVDKARLTETDRAKNHNCRYCGRAFTTANSMSRHVRSRCKVANSEEGMEQLMNHTIQRQLADQGAQIARLTMLLEQQMATGAVAVPATVNNGPVMQNNGPVTQNNGPITQNNGPITQNNTINVTQQKIVIQPWDGEHRISLTAEMIAEAFAENPRLVEYCKMTDREKTNPEGAGPYVLEALMDLTKRAHKDPLARNVYLNPKRADQVMVCLVDGSWEVRSLEEATRMMFDGVAMEIKRVVRSNEERGKLPFHVQGSASYVPMMYEDEQDRFVTMAKKPVSAHLTNTVPALK